MEIIDSKKETNFKRVEKKTQIVIVHTSRTLIDYMTSIKHRYKDRSPKVPHYVIDRKGFVLQTLDDKIDSNFFNNGVINHKSIVISLENLGWLEKVPLQNYYINWIGNIYKGKVFDRKWRDYFFWQPYTEIQLEKTVELCEKLCDKHKITLRFVGHNTKVKGIESFLGVITKSNFDDFATDLSPAFDFEKFNKLLNYE